MSDRGSWIVYTGPFEHDGSAGLEVLAHRIGFAPARGRLAPR